MEVSILGGKRICYHVPYPLILVNNKRAKNRNDVMFSIRMRTSDGGIVGTTVKEYLDQVKHIQIHTRFRCRAA